MLADPNPWDRLYQDERFLLRYPSEHVVRFLADIPKAQRTLALDIGCGAGRHLRLLREMGCAAYGCDASMAAISQLRRRLGDDVYAHLDTARMTALPYKDDHFQIALAWGVFYYGTKAEMAQAIGEMHRVLRPGGWGFMSLRTLADWHHSHTKDGVFRQPDEPEDGMAMSFCSIEDVRRLAGDFSVVDIGWLDRQQNNRLSSDWLVLVRK